MNYIKMFDDIVANNRVANSYIFYGNIYDAFKNAELFAKSINKSNAHIYTIDKDDIKVEDLDLIVEGSQYVPSGYHKIFILNNFDKINSDIDDVLLKTLEDSKKGIVIILIVKNLNLVKDTIKSRCQKFYFRNTGHERSDYLISYFSQDFFQGFFGIDTLIKDNDVIDLLEDFACLLYEDRCDDFRIYNLIKQAIKDIKFGLEKQLVVENLMIQLRLIK